MDRKYIEKLNEVNKEAVKVFQEIMEENNEENKKLLLIQFGNEAFQTGVNFGINVKK